MTSITTYPDAEIELKHGRYRLACARHGASLRGLWHTDDKGAETAIITAYSGSRNKVGGQGDVLIPFPGRVSGGRYGFDGQTYQMALNDKETPSAIHGFLRGRDWNLTERTEGSVLLETSLAEGEAPGYPFPIAVSVRYTLSDTGFTVSFRIGNTGTSAAPVAAGFHPYFSTGSAIIDMDLLTLPFSEMLEFENLLPTGRVLPVDGTGFDFQEPKIIGATVFNTCFLAPKRDPDQKARIHLTSAGEGTKLAVWMSDSFNYVVLYSGDPLPDSHRRRALAIEPMTCSSDALNHPDWGLVALPPGEVLTGEWGVGVE